MWRSGRRGLRGRLVKGSKKRFFEKKRAKNFCDSRIFSGLGLAARRLGWGVLGGGWRFAYSPYEIWVVKSSRWIAVWRMPSDVT